MVRLRTSTALLSLLAVVACSPDASSPSPLTPGDTPALARAGNSSGGTADANQLVASARAATARFHRVEEALSAGYQSDAHCVAILGAGMGYHYVNPHLVDDVYDPTQPEALLYEPMKNGKLRLVAVEYLYAGSEAPESGVEGTFTQTQVPGATWDYDMHAWIWLDNPEGMFAPFNPNVSCEYAP